MAPYVGTRDDSCEIISSPGSGGMCEVCRTRDAELCSVAAFRTLPMKTACGAQSIANLEREARMLAYLNRPGFAAIYPINESNGFDTPRCQLQGCHSLERQ